MRGRKPKPTAMKVLEGNPGRRPINAAEPVPAADAIAPPEWLAGRALQVWHQVAPELERIGVLTNIDVLLLAGFCRHYVTWLEAESRLSREGRIVMIEGRLEEIKTEGGGVRRMWVGSKLGKHPMVSIANDAYVMMIKSASELGLSPAARSRIKVRIEPEVVDELAELRASVIDVPRAG